MSFGRRSPPQKRTSGELEWTEHISTAKTGELKVEFRVFRAFLPVSWKLLRMYLQCGTSDCVIAVPAIDYWCCLHLGCCGAGMLVTEVQQTVLRLVYAGRKLYQVACFQQL